MNAGLFANPAGLGGSSIATAEPYVAGFYQKNKLVLSPVSRQFYIKVRDGVTTADPSDDTAGTDWAIVGAPARRSYQEITINMAGGDTATVAAITAIRAKYTIHLLGAVFSAPSAGGGFTIEYTSSTSVTARKIDTTASLALVVGIEDFW